MNDPGDGSWTNFDDRQQLVSALSADIAAQWRSAALQGTEFLLGLSGGSTPIPVYECLADMDLPWSGLRAVIVDERQVPLDHPHSNEGMVRRTLLRHHAEAACIGLWSESASLTDAAYSADQRMRALGRAMDTVVLGMGEDGHFASCFPGASEYAAAIAADGTRCVLPIAPLPASVQPAVARWTLTWSYIRQTRNILLAITGAAKRDVLMRAQQERDTGTLPIAALFQPESPPIHIYWSP